MKTDAETSLGIFGGSLVTLLRVLNVAMIDPRAISDALVFRFVHSASEICIEIL